MPKIRGLSFKKKSRFISKYNLYFQSFDKPWKRKLFSSLFFLAKIARRNAKIRGLCFKKKAILRGKRPADIPSMYVCTTWMFMQDRACTIYVRHACWIFMLDRLHMYNMQSIA